MSSAYTPAVMAEMYKIGTFTQETARGFAHKHGLSLKSVIGKVVFEPKLKYDNQNDPTVKQRRKADIVRSVESLLGTEKDSLYQLGRASTAALLMLEDILLDHFGRDEDYVVDDESDSLDEAVAETGDLDDVSQAA